MQYRKFVIITKDDRVAEIKCALCEFHYQLIPEGYRCYGGGMFVENPEKKELLLHGRSVDYGEPRFFENWSKLTLDKKYQGWTVVYVKNIEGIKSAVRADITNKITFE